MSSSKVEQHPASPSPPKKSTRSQSPRAKERRRLQNRIAQRNHRRKLKERAAGTDESASPEERLSRSCSASSDTSSRHSSPRDSGAMESTFLAEYMLTGDSSAWANLDLALVYPMPSTMDAAASAFDPACFMSLAPECTCNGVTGPCAHHLDDFQERFVNMMAAPLPPPPHPPLAPSPSLAPVPAAPDDPMFMQPMSFEAAGGNELYDLPVSRGPHPSQHGRTLSRHSRSRSQSVQQARRRKRSATMALPLSQIAASVTPSHSPEVARAASSPALSPIDAEAANASAANSVRFKAVLDFVRNAGFQDFDSMVTSYYTTQFEKNSLADVSQRASRGRRLHKLLHDLHESSNRWSKWESRGFKDSVMQSARRICVAEMDKVAQDHPREQERYPVPAFDGLGNDNESVMSTDKDRNAGLSSLGLSASSHLTVPDDMETLQDEAPNVWSILTEMAGPDGLQCDQVSQSVLESLVQARRSQKTKLNPFVGT
ncbi:Uu.00g014940.m01.CDS01 [Anthostomella pinea]|uniref:Uu.00g014940.m01.CDS01 n=1 Tax=Anthostomella pinea TaxID=933095 RepID=A0AAI8VZ02_9PEZI|nr:Uu.00g014940.m01.CDS01 [Anthostomella pinea]